jgi:hypothetical protein
VSHRYAQLSSVILLCAVALGSPGRASAQAAVDACKLLAPAEVSSTVGVSLGVGQRIDGSSGCAWSSPSQQNARVTLVIADAADWETMKRPLSGITKLAAAGIGDDAFYTTVANLTSLSVKHGRTIFVIRLYGIKDHSDQMSMERALAAIVTGRL